MMSARNTGYFDDLVARTERAHVVRSEPWASLASISATRSCGAGSCKAGIFFVPHSIVHHSDSALTDVTPDPSGTVLRLVEHYGPEAEFAILRQGRDGG